MSRESEATGMNGTTMKTRLVRQRRRRPRLRKYGSTFLNQPHCLIGAFTCSSGPFPVFVRYGHVDGATEDEKMPLCATVHPHPPIKIVAQINFWGEDDCQECFETLRRAIQWQESKKCGFIPPRFTLTEWYLSTEFPKT